MIEPESYQQLKQEIVTRIGADRALLAACRRNGEAITRGYVIGEREED